MPATPLKALMLMADCNGLYLCLTQKVDHFLVIYVASSTIMIAGCIREARGVQCLPPVHRRPHDPSGSPNGHLGNVEAEHGLG